MPFPFIAPPSTAGRPLVLGHRGASAEAPENTLAALRLAMTRGADGVELDAWRCATGEIVVIHDEETTRTCGARLAVPDASLAALRALDAGAWKGEAFRGERIPLLAEVLEALPGAVVNVELKARTARPDPELARSVARVLADARAAERVIVSSFDSRLVRAFREASPRVATGLLVEPSWHWRLRLPLARWRLSPSAVHPDRTLCTPTRLARWRAAGLAVNAWTVDDPEEAGRLARGGAGALIANAPGAVREAVRRACGR
jgi:glycerophosphoryl diester phosphodiesterase